MTAKVLGLSEFDVFSSAYRAWHHRKAEMRFLEAHFISYMFDGAALYPRGIAGVWIGIEARIREYDALYARSVDGFLESLGEHLAWAAWLCVPPCGGVVAEGYITA